MGLYPKYLIYKRGEVIGEAVRLSETDIGYILYKNIYAPTIFTTIDKLPKGYKLVAKE